MIAGNFFIKKQPDFSDHHHLHRNDCFYTAKAHFLIIPRLCIKLSKIISLTVSKITLNQMIESDF